MESCDCNKDGYTQRTTAVRLWYQVSHRSFQRSKLLSKSSANMCSVLSCSKIWLSHKSILIAFWLHLQNCRSFHDHLRILLLSFKPLCLAPVGPGSIWKYFEPLLRLTGMSGRFTCGFLTDCHFAGVVPPSIYSIEYSLKISFSISYSPCKVIFRGVKETWKLL